MRQIILDTETTGLSVNQGHRIVEIGCVELLNRRYSGRHFHYYINPERTMDKAAEEIHGLDDKFLADKPLFRQIAAELVAFIEGAELLIHNVPFDVSFLDYELQIAGSFQTIAHYCQITDTLLIARQKHPSQQNNLDALCKRYKVDFSEREFHGALLDARLLAEVYLKMTGGQTTLFGQENRITQQNAKKKKVSSHMQNTLVLPIIFADSDELIAHQRCLQAIARESGGKLMWQKKDEKMA